MGYFGDKEIPIPSKQDFEAHINFVLDGCYEEILNNLDNVISNYEYRQTKGTVSFQNLFEASGAQKLISCQ